MLQRLLDENSWHRKAIHGVLSAPKVAYVLVYFTGLFAVITVDSFLRKRKFATTPRGVNKASG